MTSSIFGVMDRAALPRIGGKSLTRPGGSGTFDWCKSQWNVDKYRQDRAAAPVVEHPAGEAGREHGARVPDGRAHHARRAPVHLAHGGRCI